MTYSNIDMAKVSIVFDWPSYINSETGEVNDNTYYNYMVLKNVFNTIRDNSTTQAFIYNLLDVLLLFCNAKRGNVWITFRDIFNIDGFENFHSLLDASLLFCTSKKENVWNTFRNILNTNGLKKTFIILPILSVL